MREFIYNLGTKYWNNEINNKYKFLMNSQYWELEMLLSYQLEKLKIILNIAYDNSLYYKKLYDDNNISPESIKCLDDLKLLPIVTKKDLLENKNNIQITKKSEKLYFAETSGSTGEPLVFYRDKEWDAWMRASLYRGYTWHGVKPWERNGFLWGYNFSFSKQLKVRVLDELQNRFRLFSYNNDEVNKFLRKLENAVFISGYSSMVYEIAKAINKNGSSNRYSIKMVMGASEKIYDHYQDEIKQAFGKRMINEYGATETGMVAFECTQGCMHVNMETNIVEEVDNELVITNLTSNSFPIIRYKLGDYIELDKNNSKCECGMKHVIVKDILGRTGKVIYGIKDNYPSFTLYYIFKNLAINKNITLNYVAVQKEKGTIEFYIDRKLDKHELDMLMVEYTKYFKDDLKLNLRDGEKYNQDNRKRVDFISLMEQ